MNNSHCPLGLASCRMVVLPMGIYQGYRSQCHTATESAHCHLVNRLLITKSSGLS